MAIDGIGTRSTNACLGPEDDAPKVDGEKKDEKKQLDANAAANQPAGASQQKSVLAFALPQIRPEKDPRREIAEKTGKDVLSKGCVVAITGLGAAAVPRLGPAAPLVGAMVGVGVAPLCEPGGAQIGGALFDAATGGPNLLHLTTQRIEIPIAPGAPATATAPASSSASSSTSSSASATSSTPASTPDFSDPSASYLRAGTSP